MLQAGNIKQKPTYKRGINKVYYFTHPATTGQQRCLFPSGFGVRVSETARETRGNNGGESRLSLPLTLSLSCGRNQHPEPYGCVTMATLQEGRQEQGGVASCGARV